jgi:hypothetical protein
MIVRPHASVDVESKPSLTDSNQVLRSRRNASGCLSKAPLPGEDGDGPCLFERFPRAIRLF